MIKSFRDNATQRLWVDGFAKRFSGIEKQALRKLDMLHHARDLSDLRAPPANRLEALTGDRRGQHDTSFRIERPERALRKDVRILLARDRIANIIPVQVRGQR